MAGFTKLSSTIVHSTLWREPNHIRIVWVTLLALADGTGYVGASVPGLADAARVTLEECEQALASFLGPDPYSRTKAHEGRRIEVVEGGWLLLNHALYRAGRDHEARRLQNRAAQARKRERDRQQRQPRQPESAHSEAEAEAERDTPCKPPKGGSTQASPSKRKRAASEKPRAVPRPEDFCPTEAQKARAREHGIDVELSASAFCSHHDSKGNRFVSWEKAFTTWLTNEIKWKRERQANGQNGRPLVQQGAVGEFRQGDRSWLDEPKEEA